MVMEILGQRRWSCRVWLDQVTVMNMGLVNEVAMVAALVGIIESSPKGYNLLSKLIKSMN